MFRLRYTAALTLLGAGLLTGIASAQQSGQQSGQPLQSILAGKKFTPPLKGEANIEFTQPTPKREKDMVVTTLQVKNISNGPIARLTVDETWYDKTGGLVTGGKGQINGLLQPGEVQTIKIETPYNAKMNSNNYQFTHVNGTVKPHKVKSFDEAAKEPAAKKASASKKK
jgi:hypothetical protein